MTNQTPDWEKELKRKPFRRSSFTPQMMRRVEEEAAKRQPSRVVSAARLTGAAVLGVALVVGGTALERSGVLDGLRQQQTAQSVSEPTDENGQAARSAGQQLAVALQDGAEGAVANVPLVFAYAGTQFDEEKPGGSHESKAFEPDTTGDPRRVEEAVKATSFAVTETEASTVQALMIVRKDDQERYLTLIPAGWTGQVAAAGLSGSVAVELENPQNPKERMLYDEHSSKDSPTIWTALATYFPARKQEAEQHDIRAETRSGQQLRLLYTSESGGSGFSRYEWTSQGRGAVAVGAVCYSRDEQGTYVIRQAELSLEGTSNAAAADVVLRFFEASDGVLALGIDD
ncbi:DUF4850 domain-containing protein [Saccharibacillus sp. O23]|uniref:DUF4850 domain-containing protein n=1 Tax=Saccharibacillus sp. O23 TaxID=2009338 RepID=UPI0015C5D017|nr:DUF4850 domain-containing protein [Saccharibacillus sp. O23]